MSILKLLNKTVSIWRIDRDHAGDPTRVSLGDWRGHLEYDRKKIFSRDGEEITTESIVYVDQDAPLTPTSEYEVEVDGFTMTTELVKYMEDPRGPNKNNHFELNCR